MSLRVFVLSFCVSHSSFHSCTSHTDYNSFTSVVIEIPELLLFLLTLFSLMTPPSFLRHLSRLRNNSKVPVTSMSRLPLNWYPSPPTPSTPYLSNSYLPSRCTTDYGGFRLSPCPRVFLVIRSTISVVTHSLSSTPYP